MGVWVTRRQDGSIISRSAVQQMAEGGSEPLPNQEYLEDDSPELLEVAVADAKKLKRLELTTVFNKKVSAGMPVGDAVLQIDDASRANISAISVRAGFAVIGVPGITWPGDFAWRMADDSWMPMTAAQFLAMAQNAANRYTALRVKLGALKDRIDAAADLESLETIDLENGW